MASVLILGARAPAALELARRFAAHGWRVIVGDSAPFHLCAWSRAVAARVALPPPRTAFDDYAHALAAAVAAHGIELIVPTCEEVFHLAAARPCLPAAVRVACADPDTLRSLHSKWLFVGEAARAGMRVPDSALVDSLDEARDWAGGRGVVLKPEFSRFGVHVRRYPDGIPGHAPALVALGRWVVQAFQYGEELCSYGIADRGRLLAHAAYRPGYRLGGSSGYWFESVDAAAIRESVAALVARLGYTGQIAFDWIGGPDGSAVAIECNPRAVSGVHLFAADDDLPAALTGSAKGCINAAPGVARMIGSVMLTLGPLAALRGHGPGRWLRDWHRARDVVAVAGDRAPLLGGTLDLARMAALALGRRCSLREASTLDIEWDGGALPSAHMPPARASGP